MRQILLLEPDKLLAGSIKSYFANAKYAVSVHSDPQQAVSQADKQLPSAVITELQLASRSGIEFLYEFRSYPDWQDIPVIIFTVLNQEELLAYADIFKDLNVTTVLHKPHTSLSQLLQAVNHSLKIAA